MGIFQAGPIFEERSVFQPGHLFPPVMICGPDDPDPANRFDGMLWVRQFQIPGGPIAVQLRTSMNGVVYAANATAV